MHYFQCLSLALAHWVDQAAYRGVAIQAKQAKVVAVAKPNATCCVCVMVVHIIAVIITLQIQHWRFHHAC